MQSRGNAGLVITVTIVNINRIEFYRTLEYAFTTIAGLIDSVGVFHPDCFPAAAPKIAIYLGLFGNWDRNWTL